jgi:hypothetical protein
MIATLHLRVGARQQFVENLPEEPKDTLLLYKGGISPKWCIYSGCAVTRAKSRGHRRAGED